MQTVGLKRDQKDQYYTKNEVAKKCIEIFDKNILVFIFKYTEYPPNISSAPSLLSPNLIEIISILIK